MAGLTFDSGALIAAERGKRRFWSLWAEAFCRETPAVIPAPALAQVWRDPPGALRARVVRGAVVELLDSARARLTGMLWSRTGSSDVVDAAVVVSAAQRGDLILTADPDDLRPLAAAVGNVEVRSLSA
jgi:hypothetical protein